MKKDKKNIDEKINLVLLNKIGKTTLPKKISLKSNEIRNFLNSYLL
jgi:3-dehydroquinate synthetase